MAARLDAALAALRADPTAEPAGTTETPAERDADVVPLRRPSRLSRLVVAAAAVLVVGFGVTQVVEGGGQPADDAGSGADSAGQAESGGDAKSAPDASAETPPPDAFVPLDELGIEGLEPIRRTDLDDDLTALKDEGADAQQRSSARRLATVCGPRTRVPGTRTLPAAYDGRPTLVVYLPPEGGSQTVDLYLCDALRPRVPFRSVTLPTG